MNDELTDEQREIAWRWYCALRAVENVACGCHAAGIPVDLVADWLLSNVNVREVARWSDV